jgi:hypothetical protein
MDPPWRGTGCKLNYKTLTDDEWMEKINFDELMDDGLVFMRAVNCKIEIALAFMMSRGWYRKEIFR